MDKMTAFVNGGLCGCKIPASEAITGWHYIMGDCVGPFSLEMEWGDPRPTAEKPPITIADLEAKIMRMRDKMKGGKKSVPHPFGLCANADCPICIEAMVAGNEMVEAARSAPSWLELWGQPTVMRTRVHEKISKGGKVVAAIDAIHAGRRRMLQWPEEK